MRIVGLRWQEENSVNIRAAPDPSAHVHRAVHAAASSVKGDLRTIHAGATGGPGGERAAALVGRAPQARRRMREGAPADSSDSGGARAAVEVCGEQWPGAGRYVLLLTTVGGRGVREAAFDVGEGGGGRGWATVTSMA